jgi:hypothetical protein
MQPSDKTGTERLVLSPKNGQLNYLPLVGQKIQIYPDQLISQNQSKQVDLS